MSLDSLIKKAKEAMVAGKGSTIGSIVEEEKIVIDGNEYDVRLTVSHMNIIDTLGKQIYSGPPHDFIKISFAKDEYFFLEKTNKIYDGKGKQVFQNHLLLSRNYVMYKIRFLVMDDQPVAVFDVGSSRLKPAFNKDGRKLYSDVIGNMPESYGKEEMIFAKKDTGDPIRIYSPEGHVLNHYGSGILDGFRKINLNVGMIYHEGKRYSLILKGDNEYYYSYDNTALFDVNHDMKSGSSIFTVGNSPIKYKGIHTESNDMYVVSAGGEKAFDAGRGFFIPDLQDRNKPQICFIKDMPVVLSMFDQQNQYDPAFVTIDGVEKKQISFDDGSYVRVAVRGEECMLKFISVDGTEQIINPQCGRDDIVYVDKDNNSWKVCSFDSLGSLDVRSGEIYHTENHCNMDKDELNKYFLIDSKHRRVLEDGFYDTGKFSDVDGSILLEVRHVPSSSYTLMSTNGEAFRSVAEAEMMGLIENPDLRASYIKIFDGLYRKYNNSEYDSITETIARTVKGICLSGRFDALKREKRLYDLRDSLSQSIETRDRLRYS